eukprot:8518599-Pyramimonas_sp.AAC.1
MSQAKRPRPSDFCEDVSAPLSLGWSQLLSQQHPVQQAVWGRKILFGKPCLGAQSCEDVPGRTWST